MNSGDILIKFEMYFFCVKCYNILVNDKLANFLMKIMLNLAFPSAGSNC